MPDTYYWVARGTNFARVSEVRDLTQRNGRKGYPGAFFKQEGEDGLLLLDDTDCFCMTGGRQQMAMELDGIRDYVIRLRQLVGSNRSIEMWGYHEKVHLGGDRVTAIMIAQAGHPGVPETMERIRNPNALVGDGGADDPPWGATVELRKVANAMPWVKD
jgi:hypothetical protein